MRIRLLVTKEGIGKAGQILDVSEDRAERWTGPMGLAELAVEPKPEPKPDDPKPDAKKKG